MLEKLEAIKRRWEEIGIEISSPDIMQDMKRYASLNKSYKELQEVVDAYEIYKDVISNIDHARAVISNEKDEDFKEMAKAELDELNGRRDKLEEEIRLMLVPSDPEDKKNAIIEIRAGTGGDEASIFAGDLYRMYTRYCDTRGWKCELVDFNDGTNGGFKEVIFNVIGNKSYGQLKYESGVHRVQRVPQTETQGRVHTSAATVVVMPEADELDVEVKENDIRTDTFCSS